MLENSLIKLVQNVGCNWTMNVAEWEAMPEWPIDTAGNIFRHAVWMESLRLAIRLLFGLLDDLFSPFLGATFCWRRVLKVISRSLALDACTIFCAGNKALFWVVRNIAGKDRVHASNSPIRTNHFHAIGACLDKRLQDNSHRLVK